MVAGAQQWGVLPDWPTTPSTAAPFQEFGKRLPVGRIVAQRIVYVNLTGGACLVYNMAMAGLDDLLTQVFDNNRKGSKGTGRRAPAPAKKASNREIPKTDAVRAKEMVESRNLSQTDPIAEVGADPDRVWFQRQRYQPKVYGLYVPTTEGALDHLREKFPDVAAEYSQRNIKDYLPKDFIHMGATGQDDTLAHEYRHRGEHFNKFIPREVYHARPKQLNEELLTRMFDVSKNGDPERHRWYFDAVGVDFDQLYNDPAVQAAMMVAESRAQDVVEQRDGKYLERDRAHVNYPSEDVLLDMIKNTPQPTIADEIYWGPVK